MPRWLKKELQYEKVAGIHIFKIGHYWIAVSGITLIVEKNQMDRIP